ncbi:MAG: YafY family transcriptional regulator [Rhodospirillaceae bacterium]|nr:YafY family transcriptional regulator [Rhodospirillales bacterium]
MRRADRLFQIVQCLRGGRLVTARDLAQRLEVSERTIYRDMAELIGTGVPITGEAGVGYVLRGGFDIPPLMFTADEVEALLVGARMVKAWGGTTLVRAAEEALAKIEAVIPSALRDGMAQSRLFAPGFSLPDDARELLDLLRDAITGRRFIHFGYTDESGSDSERRCRPLGLYFWGKVWTLVGWCELRSDFRMFRIDRMRAPTVEDMRFQPEPGRNLTDFLRTVIPAGASGALPGS